MYVCMSLLCDYLNFTIYIHTCITCPHVQVVKIRHNILQSKFYIFLRKISCLRLKCNYRDVSDVHIERRVAAAVYEQ